jgi:shikimate kinase
MPRVSSVASGSRLSPFITYLLGYPGVGKYTVARALASKTGAVLVDNHVVNQPILALLNWDGITQLPSGTLDRTAPIRDAMLTALEEIAPRSMSYVFTNVLENKPDDVAIYDRVRGAASHRDSIFLAVMLTCAPDVQLQRVQTEERRRRFKVSDPGSVARYMGETDLFMPDDSNLMTLDTTERSPEQSATLIIERLHQEGLVK